MQNQNHDGLTQCIISVTTVLFTYFSNLAPPSKYIGLALPGTVAMAFWLEIMGSATQHNWGPICWERLAELF